MSKVIHNEICEAAARNDVAELENLLDHYPGFDGPIDLEGFLGHAVENDAADATAWLIDRGASANPPVSKPAERSLLMSALYYTADNSAMVLLEKGADVSVQGPDGYPLHYAVRRGASREVILKMMEKGADMNAAIDFYGTPLDCARYHTDALEVFNDIIRQKEEREKLEKLEAALAVVRNGLPYDLKIGKPFILKRRQ